jgi:putative transposase
MPNPQPSRRPNSMRHAGYDYTSAGAYFVTICTHRRNAILGQVVEHKICPTPLGEVAHQAWLDLDAHHAHIQVDASVVMPNHTHALLWILSPAAGADQGTGTQRQYGRPIAGSLSTLINAYKMMVTKRALNIGLIPAPPLWQRNFWDRIVRNEHELNTIRTYIQENPARWENDQLHPDAPPNRFNRA